MIVADLKTNDLQTYRLPDFYHVNSRLFQRIIDQCAYSVFLIIKFVLERGRIEFDDQFSVLNEEVACMPCNMLTNYIRPLVFELCLV